MQKFKKALGIATILMILSFLAGCGFHPRSAASIPPQLHTLAIETQKPYNNLITQLKAMLRSLNITLKKNRSQAPYTLEIPQIVFTQSNPPIRTTTLAVTLTYSLTVQVRLVSRSGKIIIPKTRLTATRSISQNPSQVYTPGTATLSKQELRRDILSKIYYLLTVNNTRKALNHVH